MDSTQGRRYASTLYMGTITEMRGAGVVWFMALAYLLSPPRTLGLYLVPRHYRMQARMANASRGVSQ